MPDRYSRFGARFAGASGTRLLMDDLGEALESGADLCNLGGGNPARIPAIEAVFRDILQAQIADGTFARLSGNYDGPQGYKPLLRAVAQLFHKRYGWPLTADNVAITAGSQSSFFILFNLLTGTCNDGRFRHLQLPLTPEYIGYADVGPGGDAIRANRPRIEMQDDGLFKYHIDFESLHIDDDTGAVCVSRPTNPTGNVLSAQEMAQLLARTRSAGVPLIIDNAYGVPFPYIVFGEAEPVYAEHVIYCLSLSKLGLPGLRTGIVIANPEIIEAVRSTNAILSLATGSLGASIATPLFEGDGEVIRLARDLIQPYYRERVQQAVLWCRRHFGGLDFHIHKPEGAIFLWLWFPGLPITAQTLYERLKQRNVLVIPGHYFFPGLQEAWPHMHECLRISYAQSPEQVERGIAAIGEEIRRAFSA